MDWQFEAMLSVQPIPGGLGNVDQFKTTRDGQYFEGVTLRVFNPTTEEWNLHWVDSVRGALQPPLVGRFEDERGEFFANDNHQGTPVLARFLWHDISADFARWDQAFSTDEGHTWETNWKMEFVRVATPS